jgi:hypothetical protein
MIALISCESITQVPAVRQPPVAEIEPETFRFLVRWFTIELYSGGIHYICIVGIRAYMNIIFEYVSEQKVKSKKDFILWCSP